MAELIAPELTLGVAVLAFGYGVIGLTFCVSGMVSDFRERRRIAEIMNRNWS